MTKITFEQAKEFLENINSNDKVAIIHDDDLDGFTSAILIYRFCQKKGATCSHHAFQRSKSKISKLDLSKENKIIITDLGPDFIAEDLEKLEDKKVLYIDHHQKNKEIPEFIEEYRTESKIHCARTSYDLTKESLKEEDKLIALLALFADMGYLQEENLELAKPLEKHFNLTLEETKNIVHQVGGVFTFLQKDLNKAFEEINSVNSLEDIKRLEKYWKPIEAEIEKHLQDYKTKGEKIGPINYFYFEPEYFVKSAVTTILSKEKPEETYVFAMPQGENILVSARNQSKKVSMPDLLNAGINGFENAMAGGHIPAAGASFLKKDLQKFKENLRNYVE